ncbi:cytochrome P450 [Auriculariales sp. MPI-PUGE-AT-0066]|nr:cytochrome P450 [Auriculariales sp. MPI-PUGE-AT-0066]
MAGVWVALKLALGFSAIVLSHSIYLTLRRRILLAPIPGPRSTLWIWGCAWDLYTSPPGKLLREWVRTYGGIVRSPGPFGSYLLSVTDRRAVQHILSSQNCYDFPKPDGVRAFFDLLLGRSVIWAEGEQHVHQRRTLAPAFTQQALRDMTPIIFDCANKVAARWAHILETSPSERKVIDVQLWANRMSLDAIGLAGFNHDFESLTSQEPTPLAKALGAFTNSTASPNPFVTFAIQTLTFRMPAVLKLPSKRNRTIQAARRKLNEATRAIWHDLKSSNGSESSKTILGVLRRASANQNLSDDLVAAEMLTLVFGGYETTSCTLSWVLYELARHPAVQSQLRAELNTHAAAEPTFEDFQHKLPFLDAVVNETLRLHPAILDPHRQSAVDSYLPLSNGEHVFVPSGVVLHIPICAMQRDPAVWGPDAETFRPSRWLNGVTEESDRRSELLAFGAGPRMCIGKHFAMLEIKAAVSTLIRQFVLAPAPGMPIEEFVSFVVRPRVRNDSKSTLPLLVSKVT